MKIMATSAINYNQNRQNIRPAFASAKIVIENKNLLWKKFKFFGGYHTHNSIRMDRLKRSAKGLSELFKEFKKNEEFKKALKNAPNGVVLKASHMQPNYQIHISNGKYASDAAFPVAVTKDKENLPIIAEYLASLIKDVSKSSKPHYNLDYKEPSLLYENFYQRLNFPKSPPLDIVV